MERIKFFLFDPSSKKETPIFLSVTYLAKRAKLKTKQKVKPRAWNKNSYSIKANFTEYSEVQNELDRIKSIVSVELQNLKNTYKSLPEPRELKRILENKIFSEADSNIRIDFWGFFGNYLDEMPKKVNPQTGKIISKSTIVSYNQTFQTLKKFEATTGSIISFSTLSNKDYDLLKNFLQENQKMAPNTIGKHIKNLKRVINAAREENVTISKEYKEKYWHVTNLPKPQEEKVFLTEKELVELWELDLSKTPLHEKIRDIFLIGAWTGLRISDVLSLEVEDFNKQEGFLQVRMKKNNKIITLPLHPVVKAIIIKYEQDLPKASEPVINREIKEICKNLESMRVLVRVPAGNKIERFKLVTTHAGRRSFASNMFKRKMPIDEIMALTGHVKRSDFNRYMGITNDEIANSLSEKFKIWYPWD